MKDRIQQIIDYKGISAGDMAEKLDVQRSNISHILNGRNNPGAVFIEKLLQAFPDINARWLLTGEGPMVLNDVSQVVKSTAKPGENKNKLQPLPAKSDIPARRNVSSEDGKILEKIVLLYSDGTFTYYNHS